MKGKLFTIASILMIVSMLLAACAQTPAATTEAPKVIKIGLIAPYTGPNSRVGDEMKAIHETAFGEINWEVCGYKIEPVYIDDESDPEKAVRAFKDAVLKENIQAATGGYHSSVTVALMDPLAENKIPYFFPQNESSVIVEKFRSDPEKYAYHSWKGRPSPVKLMVGYDLALFKDAITKGTWAPANQKFSILCEDTDFGRDMCAGFKDMAVTNGWEMVTEDYVPLDASDVYPILTKVKAAEPSLFFISMGAPAVATGIIKQTREVGLDALVISHGLGWIGEWYELTGDAGDYVLDMMQKWSTPEQIAYRDTFKQKFNMDPSASLSISYDYDKFFIKIMERACEKYGKLDKESIFNIGNDEVSKGILTYTDGLWYDELKWAPETLPEMVVGEGFYLDPVIQYFGGEATVIWPDNRKEADLMIKE